MSRHIKNETLMLAATYRAAVENPRQAILYLARKPVIVWAAWKHWAKGGSHNDLALTTSFPNGSTVEFRAP